MALPFELIHLFLSLFLRLFPPGDAFQVGKLLYFSTFSAAAIGSQILGAKLAQFGLKKAKLCTSFHFEVIEKDIVLFV